MIHSIEATGTVNVPVSVKAGAIFSWSNLLTVVLTINNRLPEPWLDVIPVNNVADLKTAVKMLAVLMGAFLMAGLYDALLVAEGGAL